jgi:hypothetical protein
MTQSTTNLLYYGDNLDILHRYIKDETVDLVYLDPPFNSNINYNAKLAEATADYGEATKRPFHVVGEPTSEPDAAALAASNPYQFQWWALGLGGARPVEQKKGADKGIDGRIIFQGDKPGTFESVILSVKAGKTGSAHVRDLKRGSGSGKGGHWGSYLNAGTTRTNENGSGYDRIL